MRQGWKAWVLAITATFAFAPAVAARARSPSSKRAVYHGHVIGTLHRSYIRTIGYGSRLYGFARIAF